jgi:mono/diheme cytochrome c family protein
MPAAAKNPAAVHAEKFSGATFHTFIVQCAGCHAVAQPARGLYLLDMSTGGEVGYTADALARVVREEDYAAAASQPWKPWMVRTRTGKDRQERYAPYAPKVFQWFGEKTAGAEIRPIALREVSRAVRAVGGVAAIDVKGADGGAVRQPSVLSDGDIRRMIAALTRQGFRNVVYVSDRVYAVEKGTLVATDRPAMAHEKPYTVEHGMAPVAQRTAYGAKGNPDGCMNCHADDAAFFAKLKIKNMRGFLKDDYPVVREPHAGPQMLDWGMSLVPAFE